MLLTIIITILATAFLPITCEQASKDFYSSKEAFQCFEKHIQECAMKIPSDCHEANSACASELSKLTCTFQEDQNLIHNGACFKKWIYQAFHTRGAIQCLQGYCDLSYNGFSQLKDLEKCVKGVIFDIHSEDPELECGEECLEKLYPIRERIKTFPLDKAYDVSLANGDKTAEVIIERALAECILYSEEKNTSKQIQGSQENLDTEL